MLLFTNLLITSLDWFYWLFLRGFVYFLLWFCYQITIIKSAKLYLIRFGCIATIYDVAFSVNSSWLSFILFILLLLFQF